MNRSIYILRWLAVLPAAIAGAFAGYYVFYYLQILSIGFFTLSDPTQKWYIHIVLFLAQSIFGAAAVYSGARVAPSHSFIVAVALAVLAIFLSGAGVFYSISQQQWITILYPLGTAFGACVMVASAYVGEQPFSPKGNKKSINN